MSDKRLVSGFIAFSKKEYTDYKTHLLSKPEWPGIDISVDKDSHVAFNIPMLIMELHRLVPYKKDCYVNFHPFNMPYIKVRKIELVGSVTHIRHSTDNLILTIEDGTGVVDINYKLETYRSLLRQRKEIDEKYRELAQNLTSCETSASSDFLKKFPEKRPQFSYPHNVSLQDRAVLENKWWSETNNGLLGKEIQLFDYVHVTGYPCLDAKFQEIPQEITMEFMKHAKLVVFALSVTCISEKAHNERLSIWIDTTIRQRYVK